VAAGDFFSAGNKFGISRNVSAEVSLCLFQVMQEALQNAAKHSGTQRFGVSLDTTLNEIRLLVRDSKIGFNPELSINDMA